MTAFSCSSVSRTEKSRSGMKFEGKTSRSWALTTNGRMASVVGGLAPQLRQHVGVVTEDERRARAVGQRSDVPVATPPGGMVAQQPAERLRPLVVVAQVELVAGEDVRAGVGEVDARPEQPRRVAREAVQLEAVEQLDVVAVQRLPVEREVQVVGEVGADVLAGGDPV